MVYGQGGIYGLNMGGRTFVGLGLQDKPIGYSVIIFLRFHLLKRERYQERLALKEVSSSQPLRKGRNLTEYIKQSIYKKNGLH